MSPTPDTPTGEVLQSSEITPDAIDAMFDVVVDGPVSPPTTEEAPPSTPEPTDEKTDEAEGDAKAEEQPAKKPLLGKKPKENTMDSQLKGVQKWANRLSRQNAELAKKVQALEKTSTEFTDEKPEQSREQIEQSAKRKALEESSRSRATAEFGDEFLQEQIYGEDSTYRQLVEESPWIYHRVNNSPDPIYEALEVIKEQEFFEAYGRDPDEIKSKLKEQIKAELLKEIKADGIETGKKPPTLNGARTATGTAEAVTSDVDLDAMNPSLAAIR